MHVFVYGTLTDPEQAGTVLDTVTAVGTATLRGLHRVDGRYPTLAPGGSVSGRILETPAVDRLDEYEGVGRGLYVRVTVPVAPDSVGFDTVDVYVGDPDRLAAAAVWPGEGPFPDRVRAYLASTAVQVHIDDDRLSN